MTYTREVVEHLLPAVWDETSGYGIRNPMTPDPDMPKAAVDKSHSGVLYAHLADIRSAWRRAPLLADERRALLLRYGLDLTDKSAGQVLDVERSVVSRRITRGVGRLVAHLNGTEDSDDERYDGHDDDDQ